MVKVSFSSRFKKAFEKKGKKDSLLKERFLLKLEVFVSNPLHPSLKTHKLSGELKHLHSFSITHDIRVIFFFVREKEVIFEDIGTHDQVY